MFAAADSLAERVDQLEVTAQTAGAAVARANERLREIVERFEARAAALEPHLDSPGVAEELMAEARRSLADAVAVVDELRAELDGHAATLTAPTSPAPAATTPAGLASPSMPSMGSGFGGGSGGAPMSPLSGLGGMPSSSGLGDLAEFSQAGNTRRCGVWRRLRRPPTRWQHRNGTERRGGQRGSARTDPARRAVRLGWHDTRRRAGLQRPDPVGVSGSGTESSAAGSGAGRRGRSGCRFLEAGRSGGVGRARRDDRRQRHDDRGRRSCSTFANSNDQRGSRLSGILAAYRMSYAARTLPGAEAPS